MLDCPALARHMRGMLRICSLLVLALASPALAGPVLADPVLAGWARVVDGDTIELHTADGREKIRLHGIDAPEKRQTCLTDDGVPWACGRVATSILADMARNELRCEGLGRDRYKRLIARCFAQGRDLGAAMVERGAAYAYRKYSHDYVAQEARARAAARGVWAGQAQTPESYRAAKRGKPKPTS